MFVAKKFVVITKQNQFALEVSQLNARGAYKVETFSSANNALQFLHRNAQDAVIIDFDRLDVSGEHLIDAIRDRQPDIAIILAPDSEEMQSLVESYNIQALIKIPYPVRQLVNVIQSSIQSMYDAQPDTVVVPATDVEALRKASFPQEQVVIDDDTSEPAPAAGDTPKNLDPSDVTPPPFDPLGEFTPLPRPIPKYREEYDEPETEDPHARFRPPPLRETEPIRQEPEPSENATVFDRLKAEEPPLPSFEQSGTVKDLFETGAHEWEPPVQETTERSTAAATPMEPATGKSKNIPAAIILDRATDDSTPLEGFSITQFMARIKEEFPEGEAHIMPLPSWVEEAERYISEPDFLADDMPERSVDYTSATTAPNVPADTANIGEWGTERLEPLKRSHPQDDEASILDSRPPTMPDMPPVPPQRPPTMPDMPVVASDEPADEPVNEDVTQPAPISDFTEEFTSAGPIAEEAPEPAQVEEISVDDFEFVVSEESGHIPAVEVEEPQQPQPEPVFEEDVPEDEETYFARIALTLTQVSLELAGDATILAQDGELVAHAGPMPIGDIEELLPVLKQDWDTRPERGRIRFVHQESTGQDYMLYSRMAEGGFVLSMLFAGAQSISMIREQAQRMLDSLATVPEREVDEPSTVMEAILDEPLEDAIEDLALHEEVDADEIDIVELDESLVREPIAFVWIVRDTRMTLPQEATDLLANELGQQLLNAQWHVNELVVEGDYVYLFADVPGQNLLGNDELANLMQTSAQILANDYSGIEPDSLWADSYMVLTPGRALTTDDIQRFINFARR
ncbi:MAG: hypothetical protein KC615_17455 [Anaerolineae bacterium]|nr:hypothetical protein [Anaerolineae bacterium]